MEKLNCWQAKNCGRELHGSKSAELGVCPTAIEATLDGTHGGENGGRACWVVASTLCGGQEQGTFGQKYHNCAKCEFYLQVRAEEGAKFKYSSVLQAMMKK
ncbi:MAG: hypothetical protein A2Y38_22895 [Spirochaetes bacterium GWB1_59_5]|nr:MAG: hypothetical protein A2Y38_22895 [Spirochaetes bacterium GWB1_59_5]